MAHTMRNVLVSNAEKIADEVRDLPNFREFSLLGIKEKVAILLGMIGREGFFSTYTLHDISHIEAMLHSLDWLIPDITKEKMTKVDWLLIVLSIYFHDLGLLVTSKEYDERDQNEDYIIFKQKLLFDNSHKDFTARLQEISEDDKEKFLYQEYIRKNHALRIKEWISGRNSRYWSNGTDAISAEIGKILDTLPLRFRENLAIVCESHHKDNLGQYDLFPLCQRYGSSPQELANVQYAALLLRTSDLIHVTKDRTPAVMYNTIRLSDPVGVDEWKKQLGTFAVNMKTREFNSEDKDSHVIQVSADFTEERPFFVLAEYLAYADSEIKQTKRWADQSAQIEDGKYYSFPWHTIQGDIRVEGNAPKLMRFNLDRGKLLDLLVGHTIYNEPTVAIRELMQNAIDAVRYQYHINKKNNVREEMGKIKVTWDEETRELIVEDNGLGMDFDVIIYHLMNVGSSFYSSSQVTSENDDFTPISRFGIGVLSYFMISDNIEIVTFKQNKGYRIKMSSVHADYLLKELYPGHQLLENIHPHGTRVKLKIRSSVDLSENSILKILRYWIIIPECEVRYSDKEKTNVKIGFESAVDALKYFHFDIYDKNLADESIEILTNNVNKNGGSYEIAYAAGKRFTPEKILLDSNNEDAPFVCIEGIRTADKLPGFLSGEESLCAILSVSGNKNFRTTVSRSNLEEDSEYIEVAKLTAELLFNHVSEEVNRISNSSGNPLSQASTVGLWLNSTIINSIENTKVEKHVRKLYKKLPSIVLETVTDTGEKTTMRTLISIEELEGLKEFWVVESRLIDSLGIISRDLGRELSFNDFLIKLAPEVQDIRVSPIVSDAHVFDPETFQSHIVTVAEFSQKHQQTLIKFEPKPNNGKGTNELYSKIQNHKHEISRTIYNRYRNLDYEFGIARSINGISFRENIIIANISGDNEKINAIKTRLGYILEPRSEFAKFWRSFRDNTLLAIDILLAKDKKEDIGILCICFDYIQRVCTLNHREAYRRMWKDLRTELNQIMEEHNLDTSYIPVDIVQLITVDTKWFDASKFWLNWNNEENDFDVF